MVTNEVLPNEYDFRRAIDRDGASCKAKEFTTEAFLMLDELLEPVNTAFSYTHQQDNNNTPYIVLTNNESIADLLASKKFQDDMQDSEKRMAIVLLLLDLAVKLENVGLGFAWSIHTIYHRASYFWLNVLGVTKCRGKRSIMENRQSLILLFRYILTGNHHGRVREEQEYVFKHMMKNMQPLSYKVWELASHVFDHTKVLDFFNGIGEHSIEPQVSMKKLDSDTISNRSIDLMVKELDHKILHRQGRLTDNWFRPGGLPESPCKKVCDAIKFPHDKGTSMRKFQSFLRNFPEHWRDKQSMVARLKVIFEVELKLKTPILESRDGRPTFVYRYLRDSYPLVFVKYYKIAKKHLIDRNSDMSVIFKRNDEDDVKRARLYLSRCLQQ